MRKRKRKWLYWTGIPIFLGLALLTGLYFLLRPSPMERTEIYKGVYLTVENYPGDSLVKGRVMIAEIHWETPGIKIEHRMFSRLSMTSDSAYQFRTIPADLALLEEDAEILINSTLFKPDSLRSFIPGCKVRSLDTLVVDGKVSHVHEHSYLLYWDVNDNVCMVRSKPSPQEDLERAILGLGIQGIQINEGVPRSGFYGNNEAESLISRSFIGVDPDRKILWLMAFEKSTEQFMVQRASEEGVIFGGSLDGGSSTNMLIGNGAKDLIPHAGIRNLRSLGPYLTIQAKPL